MKPVVIGMLAVLLGGCGKSPPVLSGGKPVAYWVRVVQGPDARLRRQAAFKLGNVGPADAAAFPALVEALKDADAGVRREVILALIKFGPAAREVGPALAELRQQDPDERVRTCAARALARIEQANRQTE
jgi:HEAT repeat protein